MIKAVFFDWFNTLAKYSPPREEIQSRLLGEFGYDVPPGKLVPALLSADKELYDRHAENPVTDASPEERLKIYLKHQTTILSEVGIDISADPDELNKIFNRAQEMAKDIHFVLYEDVIPTLKNIRTRGLKTGILTNFDSDMRSVCKGLDIESYIDYIITSGEAGANKPQPQIFRYALNIAGVDAGEAIHVGDQYKIDITGAKGAGISPILLDRFNFYPDVDDCPVIHELTEVINYLD